jgi:hypothetical protein
VSLNAPPIKAPFFQAEVELPNPNPLQPARRFELRFVRTTKEWAQWIAAIASSVFFATFWSVRTVAEAYTVQKADAVILVNADVTITLPPQFPGWKKRITVKKINATAGAVTVDGDGFNIDGAATWSTSTQYESADFVGNGTQAFIV